MEFNDESDNFEEETNEIFNFNISEQTSAKEDDYTNDESSTNLYDLDKIISNNASTYCSYKPHAENDAFTTFTPKYTSENYKQKLSNLSAYSKVSKEDLPEKQTNQEALAKATDIESLKYEFEQEGIKIKEFKPKVLT